MNPKDLGHIRNITISGRIGSGATTLARNIAEILVWELIDGGKLFRDHTNDHGYAKDRSDSFDLDYEAKIKEILANEKHKVVQSHLAGFDSQGIEGVFKIFVVCEDKNGEDKADVRIDRLVNRDGMSVVDAKHELKERDRQNLEKWRRLYANNDPNWVHWDKKYYDLIINTFELNKNDAVEAVKKALNI